MRASLAIRPSRLQERSSHQKEVDASNTDLMKMCHIETLAVAGGRKSM